MMLVLVIPHEWGHMIVARLCGVRVNEFSVGMGPLLFKKKRGDTQYSVRLLPLGGYCILEGEDEAVDSSTSYSSKSSPKKIAILIAGVTMNIIIAFLAVTIAACVSGVAINTIDKVTAGSPAETAGLESGDEIIEINGAATDSWEEVSTAIKGSAEGEALDIVCMRDGNRITFSVKPEYSEELQSYAIGISAGVTHNFWTCAKTGPAATWELGKAMLTAFKTLFTGHFTADDVTGPVGLVRVVNTAADYGAVSYLMLLALVSLNLALFNVLPIPGLDGGKIFFILLKTVSRGRITDDMENKATLAGMALLMVLIVLVTANDISNIVGK